MDVTNSLKYSPNYITRDTLLKNNNHQVTVEVSEQDTFTLATSNGEQVTYDLKSLTNQSGPKEQSNVERDMSHLGNTYTSVNFFSVNINMETGEYQAGQLMGKEKVDEAFSMIERLGVEQNDKIQYLAPSQDWLELAEKMTDEQLNNLVDIAYTISEAIFFKGGGSEDVERIIQKLNSLDSDDLNSVMNTMLHLSEQTGVETIGFMKTPEIIGFGAGSGSLSNYINEGDVLVDYMAMIFSPELADKDIEIIDEHLVNMDYAQATGLMESVRLMEGESKKQLFDLLKDNETDEIAELFTYIGELSTKSNKGNAQQYQVDFGDGIKKMSTVFEPKLNDTELSSLIENVLSVKNKTDLDTVIEYIDKSSTALEQAQVAIWQAIEKSTDEPSSKLNDKYFDKLIGKLTTDIIAKHEQQIRSELKHVFEAYSTL